ncbi:hypothetical protein [Vibrio phage RYC]|nr:hypothetical protein [Vibrio phage RYC]
MQTHLAPVKMSRKALKSQIDPEWNEKRVRMSKGGRINRGKMAEQKRNRWES